MLVITNHGNVENIKINIPNLSFDDLSHAIDTLSKLLYDKFICDVSTILNREEIKEKVTRGKKKKTINKLIDVVTYYSSVATVSQLTIWRRSKIEDVKSCAITNFSLGGRETAVSVLIKANFSRHNSILNGRKWPV